jgi:hypothetical protein
MMLSLLFIVRHALQWVTSSSENILVQTSACNFTKRIFLTAGCASPFTR